jgi:hypothetical protein
VKEQMPVFMSSSDRVAQLYPQAPGSLFIAFYDSQGYGGGGLRNIFYSTETVASFIPTVRLWLLRESKQRTETAQNVSWDRHRSGREDMQDVTVHDPASNVGSAHLLPSQGHEACSLPPHDLEINALYHRKRLLAEI